MDQGEAAELLDELGQVRREAQRRHGERAWVRAVAAMLLGAGAVVLALVTPGGLELTALTARCQPVDSSVVGAAGSGGLSVQQCEATVFSGGVWVAVALLFATLSLFVSVGPRGTVRRVLSQPVTVGRMIVLLGVFFFGLPLLFVVPFMLLAVAAPLTLGVVALAMLGRAVATRGAMGVPASVAALAAVAVIGSIAAAASVAPAATTLTVPAVAAVVGLLLAVRWRRQEMA